MDNYRKNMIERIFASRGPNGLWQMIPKSHKYYPDYLHYVPNFKATLWTLILLADLKCNRDEKRIANPLQVLKNQFFDKTFGIYYRKSSRGN